jgi:hypothetical protein
MKDYRITFSPLLLGVCLAIIMTIYMKETGHIIVKKK